MKANLIYYQLQNDAFFSTKLVNGIESHVWKSFLSVIFLTFRNDPILATIPDRLTERPDFSSQFWVAFLGRKFIWSDNCFLHTMKMHFQIFLTERNKEKCNPVIPQPYGFSPVSIDVIQFSDELQIQNLLKSYYKFYKIICPFEGGFTLWQQPFFCRQFS